MLGIKDPLIIITYLMAFGCLIFALVYGIARWNERDDDETSINPENPEK